MSKPTTPRFYNLNGEEIIEVSSGACRWSIRDRRVRRSAISLPPPLHRESFWISTVFLATPHGHNEEGTPILFETAIIIHDLVWICARYTSKATAEALHIALERWITGIIEAARLLAGARPTAAQLNAILTKEVEEAFGIFDGYTYLDDLPSYILTPSAGTPTK